MQDGTAITEIFFLIGSNPIQSTNGPSLPASKLRECCGSFALKVLADTGSADALKNDVSGFLWWFSDVVSAAVLKLYKHDGTDYALSATLSDGTYGTFYSFAFFTNDQGEVFIGYQLNWKNVLTIKGEGSYKVKVEATLSIGGTAEAWSQEYCLKQYTPDRADKTIRIEYYLNGQLGINENDIVFRDLGNLNWYNSLRLSGFFGFPSAQYETDYTQYNNGDRQYIKDFQEPEFLMKLKPAPNFVHEIMRTDVMQADKVLITDYNSKNPAIYVKKAVIKNSGYEPDWKKMQSKLAPVEVKWKQEFNNHNKLKC